MHSTPLKIVKHLTEKREVELRELAAMLPKKTNDHLDYYPLASLVRGGYIDLYLTSSDTKPFREGNEMMMAISLYMWVTGADKEFEYRGMTQQGADFGQQKVFATAKAFFLLDEMRSKRIERVWALSAGIITAIVATILRGLVG